MYTFARCCVASVNYCFPTNNYHEYESRYSDAIDDRKTKCGGDKSYLRCLDKTITGISCAILGTATCITVPHCLCKPDYLMTGILNIAAPVDCGVICCVSQFPPDSGTGQPCISEGIGLECAALKDTFCPKLWDNSI